MARIGGPAVNHPSDTRAGLALGGAVGDAVIAYAKRDRSDRRWDGTRPHDKGTWQPPPGSIARPVCPLGGTWRTWVIGRPASARSVAWRWDRAGDLYAE